MSRNSTSRELSHHSSATFNLPYTRVERGPFELIFTHGLGNEDPRHKTHLLDTWTSITEASGGENNVSSLTYTARGHGKSTGWEATAESDPEQFTWQRLAHDMIYMADKFKIDRFIAGGSSMGCATSIYCAIQHPERVIGLILIRTPTAWEERKSRRHFLQSAAERLRLQRPKAVTHHVLLGGALSDFPSRDDKETWAKIKCPVLILVVGNDDGHPASTATSLFRLLPQASLFISDTYEDALVEWKPLIVDFIAKLTTNKHIQPSFQVSDKTRHDFTNDVIFYKNLTFM